MTYKIKYLPLAVQDLNDIARYLSGFYPKTASRVLKELREKITKLGDTPKMCEVYRPDPAYRRMVVDQYLVFYRVNDEIKSVEVHRVLRGSWNLPQYLEWLYDALCSCGTRIAMCRYRSIRENETLWTVTECPAPQKITTENYSWMQEWSGGHCWRMLTHREVLQDVRFDPALFYGEDALFFVTEFLKAGSLAFLNCPLYAYLERPSSAVRQEPSLRFYTAALAWEQIWQLVKGQPDPFRSTTEQRCVMSCAEVYFRLVNQPERDSEKEKMVLKTAKLHRHAAWGIPPGNQSQKLQALMVSYCPHLGAKAWKLVRWVKGLKN